MLFPAFMLESAYNVLISTNAIMCLSASTSACGRKVLERPPSTSKNVLKVLSSTSTQVLAPCLVGGSTFISSNFYKTEDSNLHC